MAENEIKDNTSEQLWKLIVAGFPRAIIDHEYKSKPEEFTYQIAYKISETLTAIPDLSKTYFCYQLRSLAIEYIKLLSDGNRMKQFVLLCKGSQGYFCRVPESCIEIIEKELGPVDYNRPKRKFVLAFMKIFNEMAENSMMLNDIDEELAALAIALRVTIIGEDKNYNPFDKDVKYVLSNVLDMHDKEIYI